MRGNSSPEKSDSTQERVAVGTINYNGVSVKCSEGSYEGHWKAVKAWKWNNEGHRCTGKKKLKKQRRATKYGK